MSLSAIQDNLVKTNLVQQTQSRVDDIARGQEIAQTAAQREHDRQGDQVVLMAQQKEQQGIRADEEREKEGRKKREEEEEEENAEETPEEETPENAEGGDPSKTGTRMVMRRINIVV